jgi:hypothetical protein
MTHDLERAGIVLVTLLAGALLALPLHRRERALAQLATLVLTPALLALTLWNNPKLATLHHHPARGVAAVALVLVVVAALAFLIDRKPALLPLLALLALPFRIPLGSVSNGLLLPLYAVIAAVALGASMVERHLTLDRAMWGSDQAASLEPNGMNRLLRDIRLVETSLGDGQKRLLDREVPIMEKLRRVGL